MAKMKDILKREKADWGQTASDLSETVKGQTFTGDLQEALTNVEMTEGATIKSNLFAHIIFKALGILIPLSLLCLVVTRVGWFARVSGSSMEDTYKEGKILFMDKISSPEKGDCVVFTDADGNALIKRVIATEFDSVRAEGGVVYVNGEAITEDYAKGETEDFALTLVSEDSYFVMGDNREVSIDSRAFGCVSKDAVLGVIW